MLRFYQMSLLVCLLSLSGCSYFKKHHFIHDYGNDYRKSTRVAPLVVPADYSTTHVGSLYPIPNEASVSDHAKLPSLLPPGSLAAQQH